MNMIAPTRSRVEVEIVFDFVCPWCYIGVEKLLQLLTARRDVEFTLRWRPFLLNPSLPQDGIDFPTYFRSRHGSNERVARLCHLITAQAEDAGVSIRFDRITRVPATGDAHRLLAWASARGDSIALVRALFAAHFHEGRDIGDRVTLADIAADQSFDRDIVLRFLMGQTMAGTVLADHLAAQKAGFNGVPSVVIGGFGLTGVHDERVVDRLIDAAIMTRPVEQDATHSMSWALIR